MSQTEPQYVLRKLRVLYANLSLKVMVSLSILTVYACLLLFRRLKKGWREKGYSKLGKILMRALIG